jgi:predicted nucleotidyltransferase
MAIELALELMNTPDIVAIKPIGAVLQSDVEGNIVSLSSAKQMQPRWRALADQMTEVCQSALGDTLHSVYVRGSASRGEAIEAVSDLDLIVVVTKPLTDEQWAMIRQGRTELEEKSKFCTKIETGVELLSEIINGTGGSIKTLKIYSACIYGQSIIDALPPVKMDRTAVRGTFKFNKEIKLRLARIESGEIKFTRQACAWMMKRILRAGGALVLERECVYARDLYPCYELFSKHYPAQESQMRRVLELALNPTDDVDKTQDLVGEFADWLALEVVRVYGA